MHGGQGDGKKRWTSQYLPNTLPRGEMGDMSPYPTVHSVMIAHHMLCGMDCSFIGDDCQIR